MKVIVIGSNGYIARNAINMLKALGVSVMATSSQPMLGETHLDFLEPAQFDYNSIIYGDLVLVAAAISSPDVCKSNYEFANQINVVGTGSFIDCCLQKGARLVYFSSDTVYGPGEKERKETDDCTPTGDYAIMKRAIESRFYNHPAFKVLRLSYVFSSQDKFTAYLTSCVRENKIAEIFHPMFRRAVYLTDLLELIKLLCSSWDNISDKVINVCGPELLSRVDMAKLYYETVSPMLNFEMIEPSPDFFIARPQIINLSDRIFSRILGHSPTRLRNAMISEFKEQEGLS